MSEVLPPRVWFTSWSETSRRLDVQWNLVLHRWRHSHANAEALLDDMLQRFWERDWKALTGEAWA